MAQKRNSQGELVDRQPSRFLEEIDNEHLQWQGGKHQRSAEEQHENALQHLDQLKALLNDN